MQQLLAGWQRRPARACSTAAATRRGRDGPHDGASAPFAHASEAELARILDFYDVRWAYEPDTFPIGWNLDGDVVESFSPDFYLPDLDLYVELTTLKQKLVRKKNRKLRRLRELYPDIRIKLFYARDFRMLLLKFGRLALIDELTGHHRPGHPAAPPSRSSPSSGRPTRAARRRRRGADAPCAGTDGVAARRQPPAGPRAADRAAGVGAAAAAARGRRRGAGSAATAAAASRATPRSRSTRRSATPAEARSSTRTQPDPGGSADPPMTRTADLQADIGEVLLSEEEIAAKVAELGRQIAADYAGRNLTLVSVLKGSLPFMADLMRQIPLPLRIDLMEVSSYGGTATESSGLVRIIKDLSASIAGRGRPARRGHHRHRADAQLPRPLPARQEPGLAQDLHAARQAGAPARRHPGGLRRLRDPRPVRRRLRPRLRRALPEPALRGRAAPRGVHARPTDASARPLGNGRRLALLGAHRPDRGLPAALVHGRRRRRPAAQVVPGVRPARASSSFLAGLATLALIALPYATGDAARRRRPRPRLRDPGRGGARGRRAVGLRRSLDGARGPAPDRAYGYWISAVGAIILGRAAFEISQEPPRR